MEQTSLDSDCPMISTTLFSFACALVRAAITSCRRVRIWRAAAAGVLGMGQALTDRAAAFQGEYVRFRRIFPRSEEHTSELQSLMRNSYSVFLLKKKNTTHDTQRLHII